MNTAAARGVDLVHGPLARSARERGDSIALDDGQTSLRFGELYDAVQKRTEALKRASAPSTVLIDDRLQTLRRVVDFLGVIASGRCAAVSDPYWSEATRHAMRASLDAIRVHSKAPAPDSPFYIGFTSGSTGLPKGFRRHHRSWAESFRICVETFGVDAASRIAVPGRFSHSLFLFGTLFGLWSGAGVVLQERFSGGPAARHVARRQDALPRRSSQPADDGARPRNTPEAYAHQGRSPGPHQRRTMDARAHA